MLKIAIAHGCMLYKVTFSFIFAKAWVLIVFLVYVTQVLVVHIHCPYLMCHWPLAFILVPEYIDCYCNCNEVPKNGCIKQEKFAIS